MHRSVPPNVHLGTVTMPCVFPQDFKLNINIHKYLFERLKKPMPLFHGRMTKHACIYHTFYGKRTKHIGTSASNLNILSAFSSAFRVLTYSSLKAKCLWPCMRLILFYTHLYIVTFFGCHFLV